MAIGLPLSATVHRAFNIALAAGVDYSLPRNYEEASKSPYSKEWKLAMDSEFHSLTEYRRWKLVIPPPDARSSRGVGYSPSRGTSTARQ